MGGIDVDRIIAYADGELSANDAKRFEADIEAAPEGRVALAGWRRLQDELRSATEPTTDPTFARDVRARIEASPRSSKRRPWVWLMVPVVAAIIFAIADPTSSDVSEFRPRGTMVTAEQRLGIEVRRHPRAQAAGQVTGHGGVIRPGEGLSFVARNLTGEARSLFVCVIDAVGSVHWLYPAKPSPTQPGVDLPAARATVALPDGITLDGLPTGELFVVALFAGSEMPFAQLARGMTQHGWRGLADALPGVSTHVTSLLLSPEELTE